MCSKEHAFYKSVLPSQDIRELLDKKQIFSNLNFEKDQIQPSSIDLRLGSKAWRMRASFLPGTDRKVSSCISEFAMQEIDLSKGYILEKGSVYLVKLQETLDLPENIEGIANAKSSTGRLDLFTRLISDYCNEFDRVIKGYNGPLYAEIAPNSFSVLAQQNIKLNQIRFKLHKTLDTEQVLINRDIAKPKIFSINLQNKNNLFIGYRAKSHTDLIDLRKVNYYSIDDFWEKIESKNKKIILDPGAFYILSSREYVSVAPNFAAEMAPYLPMIGEFRVHYAGFFDPGFGYSTDNTQKSRAVLEVRCHDTPFILEHGQKMGELIFEEMLEQPDILYGKTLKSNYQGQGLKLSKHFKN